MIYINRHCSGGSPSGSPFAVCPTMLIATLVWCVALSLNAPSEALAIVPLVAGVSVSLTCLPVRRESKWSRRLKSSAAYMAAVSCYFATIGGL